MKEKSKYFQDYMVENVCFGCGVNHSEGLQIKSYWENEYSLCHWQPTSHYRGWKQLLNGGIMATLIDCHCMCTAMACAYKIEQRALDSLPTYRYATGTLHIKYLRPVPIQHPITLKAHIQNYNERKVMLTCQLLTQNTCCAEAEVVAVRVLDSSKPTKSKFFI